LLDHQLEALGGLAKMGMAFEPIAMAKMAATS